MGSKFIAASNVLDLSDAEVLKAVEDLRSEKKHIELENMVFERFLQKNDFTLITGLLSN